MWTECRRNWVSVVFVAMLGLVALSPAQAMGGYGAEQVGTGLIQNIDYLHHSITVNGQTYTVSAQATFRGIAAFSVLNIGMPIRFMLGSNIIGAAPNSGVVDPAADPSTIVAITWLPGGLQ